MWFRALMSGFVLVSLVAACAKQSVGQRCGLDFGNDDCTPGLICRAEGTSEVNGFCCPIGPAGDIKNCAEARPTIDSGAAGQDASDTQDAADATQAVAQDSGSTVQDADAGASDASTSDASDAMR